MTHEVETRIGRALLSGQIHDGASITLDADDGKLVVRWINQGVSVPAEPEPVARADHPIRDRGGSHDEDRDGDGKHEGQPAGTGGSTIPGLPGIRPPGERATIFAYEVTSVDSDTADLRSYHIAPAELRLDETVTPDQRLPEGITVRWASCGAGTVVGSVARREDEPKCEVRADQPLPGPTV